MNYKVILEPEAAADLNAAFEWYEEQLSGLGFEFLISVQAVLAKLERNPEIYQKIDNDIRRARVRRFPFGLFYEVRGEVVHVISAFHARRDPEDWSERVSKWIKD